MNPGERHKRVVRDLDFNSCAFIKYRCVLVSTFLFTSALAPSHAERGIQSRMIVKTLIVLN